MSHDDLIKLREIFRVKFREYDFCIGEEQIEKIFKELLGEPESVVEYHNNGPSISAEQLSQVMEEIFTKEKATAIFDKDEIFFSGK